MRRLHILNGESTLRSFPLNEVGGGDFSWIDSPSEGLPPDGSPAGWRPRAEALSRQYGLDAGQHVASAKVWRMRLAHASVNDEVVPWFGGDLFCLFNLAYLLGWFHSSLWLICPPDQRLGTTIEPAPCGPPYQAFGTWLIGQP